MQEAFQEERLETKVRRVETAVPTLVLLEQPPTRDGIWQVFHFMLLCDGERADVGNHGGAAFVRLRDLLGQFDKVRVSLPHSDGVADAAFAVDDQELSVLAVLL